MSVYLFQQSGMTLNVKAFGVDGTQVGTVRLQGSELTEAYSVLRPHARDWSLNDPRWLRLDIPNDSNVFFVSLQSNSDYAYQNAVKGTIGSQGPLVLRVATHIHRQILICSLAHRQNLLIEELSFRDRVQCHLQALEVVGVDDVDAAEVYRSLRL